MCVCFLNYFVKWSLAELNQIIYTEICYDCSVKVGKLLTSCNLKRQWPWTPIITVTNASLSLTLIFFQIFFLSLLHYVHLTLHNCITLTTKKNREHEVLHVKLQIYQHLQG